METSDQEGPGRMVQPLCAPETVEGGGGGLCGIRLLCAGPGDAGDASVCRTGRARQEIARLVGEDPGELIGDVLPAVVALWHVVCRHEAGNTLRPTST